MTYPTLFPRLELLKLGVACKTAKNWPHKKKNGNSVGHGAVNCSLKRSLPRPLRPQRLLLNNKLKRR
jgi:hypothetical protein